MTVIDVTRGRPANVDRDSAAAAAIELARRLGARVDQVRVLRDGSNTSLLLLPEMIVAKVGCRRQEFRPTADWYDREVAITAYLRSSRIHAVAPTRSIPPGPHWEQGHLIAYWDWIEVSNRPIAADVLGESLRELHDVLAGYDSRKPPFDPCAECDAVLAGTPAGQFLAGERELLTSLAEPLFDIVRTWNGPVQSLHGDPTPENILPSGDDNIWCDFEDTYVGSIWWDLACLLAPAAVAGDHEFCEKAAAGYGVSVTDPALRSFVAARVMHSAIWSAYVNSPGPSANRLRRLAWLERTARR